MLNVLLFSLTLPSEFYTQNFPQCWGMPYQGSCGLFESCVDIPKDNCNPNDLSRNYEFPCPGYCKPWFD